MASPCPSPSSSLGTVMTLDEGRPETNCKKYKDIHANYLCVSLLHTQIDMPHHTRAPALSNKKSNDRADGRCYSFAWI